MTTRASLLTSLLSTALVGLFTLAPAPSEACGGYGSGLQGTVTTQLDDIVELKVSATCGDKRYEGDVFGNNQNFYFYGIDTKAKACRVAVVAIDADGFAHATSKRVKMPSLSVEVELD